MKNIWIIIKYTFREALAKKIMITFLILSALTIIGFGLAFSLMGDSVDAAALNITGETPQNISDDVNDPVPSFIHNLFC